MVFEPRSTPSLGLSAQEDRNSTPDCYSREHRAATKGSHPGERRLSLLPLSWMTVFLGREGHQHSSSYSSYLLVRLSSGQVWLNESLSVQLPLMGWRLSLECGTTKNIGALITCPPSFMQWEVPQWKRQGKKSWGCCPLHLYYVLLS